MVKRLFGALLALASLGVVVGAQPASAEPLIITTVNAQVQALPTGQKALVWTCAAQSTIETTLTTTISKCDASTSPGVEPVTVAGPIAATGGVLVPYTGTGSTITVCQTATATLVLGGSVTETSCDTIPV
jgi:hypothetical protein